MENYGLVRDIACEVYDNVLDHPEILKTEEFRNRPDFIGSFNYEKRYYSIWLIAGLGRTGYRIHITNSVHSPIGHTSIDLNEIGNPDFFINICFKIIDFLRGYHENLQKGGEWSYLSF